MNSSLSFGETLLSYFTLRTLLVLLFQNSQPLLLIVQAITNFSGIPWLLVINHLKGGYGDDLRM